MVAQVSIINVYNRISQSLDAYWKYIVDPYENGYYDYRLDPFDQTKPHSVNAYFMDAKPQNKWDRIEYDFDACDSIRVPGDWNSQKEKLYYYEGTVWYRTTFNVDDYSADNRQFLYFGAVNYKAEVYVNGTKLGTHVGGFTPFSFEITNVVKEFGNSLVVKVDNTREKDGVPTVNTDWWNYGGITRSVKIVQTGKTFIQDYSMQLSKNRETIAGYVQLNGNNLKARKLMVEIPELNILEKYTTNDSGYVEFRIPAPTYLHYWSDTDPKLYTIIIDAADDVFFDEVGFRTIETKGSEIVLNGESIFLRGISIHEESPLTHGRANSMADAEVLLGWAKELGCNYVRLAHYPHNEHIIRLADKMGILVWEENPVYWTISWENQATFANAQNQLSEIMFRDKNRACVIIWSMANETPTTSARLTFLKKLADFARSADPTRLISAALEIVPVNNDENTFSIHDDFADAVDILSFNQYIGWYNGLPEKCEKITWKIDQEKPVLISEFGAGAKYGYHGDSLTRWTEEYQAYVYEQSLTMISKIVQLQGFSPWILADFRSPRRSLPTIQDEYNRKGLLSEKGEKKQAFYILRDYYSDMK